ncbi:MAG TPA: hypothetical protein DC042_10520 [Bacteroidales bacterium]|nr:hypothetical protein [Bacteroidales bacterium]
MEVGRLPVAGCRLPVTGCGPRFRGDDNALEVTLWYLSSPRKRGSDESITEFELNSFFDFG